MIWHYGDGTPSASVSNPGRYLMLALQHKHPVKRKVWFCTSAAGLGVTYSNLPCMLSVRSKHAIRGRCQSLHRVLPLTLGKPCRAKRVGHATTGISAHSHRVLHYDQQPRRRKLGKSKSDLGRQDTGLQMSCLGPVGHANTDRLYTSQTASGTYTQLA